MILERSRSSTLKADLERLEAETTWNFPTALCKSTYFFR